MDEGTPLRACAADECLKYFNSGATGGLNCSETTLYGLCKFMGVENRLIPGIATPFGGGIGRNGYMCGSLLGALMAIGIKYGRKTVNDERHPAYERATILANKFKEKYGSLNCRDLINCDLKSPALTAEDKEEIHEKICRPLVRQVAQWMEEQVNLDTEASEADDALRSLSTF